MSVSFLTDEADIETDVVELREKRKGRGSYDYRCDGTVFVVKWFDSAIVCLASNCHQHLPEGMAKRRLGQEGRCIVCSKNTKTSVPNVT